jgi:hypothetical protein
VVPWRCKITRCRSWAGESFGRFSAEATFRPRNRHSLAGAHSNQVRLELRDHSQDVEQQPAYRVGWIIDIAAEASRIPGRSRLLPVSPWSMWMFSASTPVRKARLFGR